MGMHRDLEIAMLWIVLSELHSPSSEFYSPLQEPTFFCLVPLIVLSIRQKEEFLSEYPIFP